jgi:hypothetical protein
MLLAHKIQHTTSVDPFLTERAGQIRSLGKRVIADVIEIGKLLAECKEHCGHGNWLPWLEQEFGWSADTAERFIRLNKLAGQIPQFAEYDIPVSGLYLLAAPSTPEAAREEVITRAETGDQLTHQQIKAIVANAKPKPVGNDAEPPGELTDLPSIQQEGEPDLIRAVQTGEISGSGAVGRTRRANKTGVAMSRHAERGDDFYRTPECAVRALLKVESFSSPIWECACGDGAIVNVLRRAGHKVIATDLIDCGCSDSTRGVDFLMERRAPDGVDTILTNPPFMHADAFVRHALELAPRVVMLLRLLFLESAGRCDLIDSGRLERVYPFIDRLPMMHRDGWEGAKNSSQIQYAWFVWSREYHGHIVMQRIWGRERTYDAERDFSESINDCYAAVRERAANGGKWWEPPA